MAGEDWEKEVAGALQEVAGLDAPAPSGGLKLRLRHGRLRRVDPVNYPHGLMTGMMYRHTVFPY
jgi:hypothetical protein